MNKAYNKFLVIFSITILLGGVYLYFSNSLTLEASLVSSSGSLVNGSYSLDDKITSDIAFISTLASLKTINIDTTLFINKSFKALKDNTVELEPVVSGRANPFAPISLDVFGNTRYSSPVLTNEPLEIKNKTAVFSGLVGDTNGVTSTYFEYGLTEDLGQKTVQTTISLIGTFISNVKDLNSRTTYFYKACARISGAVLCGEVISFDTI